MTDLGLATIQGLFAQADAKRRAEATNMRLGTFIAALAAVADKTLPVRLRVRGSGH